MSIIEVANAVRYVDFFMSALLAILIVVFFTNPRNKPVLPCTLLIIWSWWLATIANMTSDFTRMGERPGPALAVRFVVSVVGLTAMILAIRQQTRATGRTLIGRMWMSETDREAEGPTPSPLREPNR